MGSNTNTFRMVNRCVGFSGLFHANGQFLGTVGTDGLFLMQEDWARKKKSPPSYMNEFQLFNVFLLEPSILIWLVVWNMAFIFP